MMTIIGMVTGDHPRGCQVFYFFLPLVLRFNFIDYVELDEAFEPTLTKQIQIVEPSLVSPNFERYMKQIFE